MVARPKSPILTRSLESRKMLTGLRSRWIMFCYTTQLSRDYVLSCLKQKNKRRANFTFIILIYWAVQWSWFARVNALCNLLCKKSRQVALSLLGWFLCRHCFTLWITMEVEHRIVKQYYCHHCCCCKNYRGKEMEGGKKVSLHRFSADQKIAISWKKCILGHPTARAASYCLFLDTWLQASKNVFKVGSVKFANSLSPPSIVKKVCTRSKSSQGT